MTAYDHIFFATQQTIEKYVAEIEEEKEKEAADKTKKKAGSSTDAKS